MGAISIPEETVSERGRSVLLSLTIANFWSISSPIELVPDSSSARLNAGRSGSNESRFLAAGFSQFSPPTFAIEPVEFYSNHGAAVKRKGKVWSDLRRYRHSAKLSLVPENEYCSK